MMAAQSKQMHQTLNISLMKSTLSTQAAQSIKMLEKLNEGELSANDVKLAPHPSAGKNIDIQL